MGEIRLEAVITIETPQDLYDVNPETLVEEVDGIGSKRAEDLTEKSLED
ncbi:hypothetical protein [Halohasta litorea]|uniref:Uncharacterized protein n=1 Tax=Halohasta litorea TaxID=869891 RepID=A0ABD6DEE0_9EURY|nr:hypothetical protein [Halohasta litorea]